jgi:hypothetical protein
MFETSSEKSKSVDLRFELARDFHRELTRLDDGFGVRGSSSSEISPFQVWRLWIPALSDGRRRPVYGNHGGYQDWRRASFVIDFGHIGSM